MRQIQILLFIMTTTVSAFAQTGKASTIKKTFSRQTSVSVRIAADREVIWALLTNADDFPRWNSTILKMEGDIAQGEKISLVSTLDITRTFKLKVKKLAPETEMVWTDGAAPFFKGRRASTLTANPDGSSTLSMSEKIGGLMFPMAAKHIPDFDASFEKFAADLKQEAEIIQHSNQ